MESLRAAIAALRDKWKDTTSVHDEIEAVLAADAALDTPAPESPPAA